MRKEALVVAIGPSSFAEADDSPRRLLESYGVQVKENPFGRRLTEDEIIAHLEGVDGLIAGLEPLNEKVLAGARPQLQAVARVGIGMDNVDQPAAQSLGIKVSNTPEPPMRAVAEATLAALLALSRNLVALNQDLHQREWKKRIGIGLYNTPILMVGYGRIGRRTAELLRAFGARILVCDPYLDPASLDHNEALVTLEEGLAQADIISLHAAGSDCVLGAAQFAAMRDGVLLLNSARGGLVDEAALLQALDSGKVGGVWFDAFWKEPYDGPLCDYPQALLTPHTATYTLQCRLEMETAAVENLLRDLGLQD